MTPKNVLLQIGFDTSEIEILLTSEEALPNLSFESLIYRYEKLHEESVIQIMANKAKIFEDWLQIFEYAPNGSDIKKHSFIKIETISKTYCHWLKIYQCTSDTKCKQRALKGMADTAETFEQWLKIYQCSPSGSDIEKYAFEQVEEVTETFEQWSEVYERTPREPRSYKERALKGMADTAETFEQWLKIYQRTSDTKCKQRALQGMVDTTKTPEECIKAYKLTSKKCAIQNFVLTRILSPSADPKNILQSRKK